MQASAIETSVPEMPLIGLRRALWKNRALIGLTLGYTVVGFVSAALLGQTEYFLQSFAPVPLVLGLVGTAVLVWLGYFFRLAVMERVPHAAAQAWKDTVGLINDGERFSDIVVTTLTLCLAGSVFFAFKILIPFFHPFDLDPLFAQIDRVLHFGVDPWRITHGLISSAWLTLAINGAYQLWFFVIWVFVMLNMFTVPSAEDRMRFFISVVAVLAVLGSLGATLLSSAGPVYFGAVTGLDDPFIPLMERLGAMDQELRASGLGVKMWALDLHRWLWEVYQAKQPAFGTGISAMPSMHVAITTLFALSAWKMRPLIRWGAIAYVGVIMIGSVQLAWHYAIDGYVSLAVTVLIWFAVKPVARWAVREEE